MRNRLAICLVLMAAAACGKDSKKGGGGGGGGGKGDKVDKVDVAKKGAACSMDFDCGNLDFDADCSWSCVKPSAGDSGPGYCQLRVVTATAGTKGCYGNKRGPETASSPPSEKTDQIAFCDIDAGVYCNETSHACEAVKAIGADCASSDECGKDGACSASRCVAAGAPGAAPVESRCQSTAYKKGDQCIARVADGQTCTESDQCTSFNCVGSGGPDMKCGPAKIVHCAL
jgi:hypothetical protein